MKISYPNLKSFIEIRQWKSLFFLSILVMIPCVILSAKNTVQDTVLVHLKKHEPYAYMDAQDKFTGYFAEVLDSIFTPLGQPYKIKIKDCVSNDIINDNADVHIITEESAITKDTDTTLSWIILHTDKGLLYRKGLDINKLSDIQNHNVGVFYKSIFLHKAKMMGINLSEKNFSEVNTVWEALEKLDNKKIDVIVVDYPLLNWLQKNINYSQSSRYNLIEIKALPTTYRLAIHPNKTHVPLEEINLQIEHLKRSGALQTLYYKWLGNNEEEHVNRLKGNIQNILFTLFGVLAALVIVIAIIYNERKRQAGFYNDFTNILMHLPHAVDIFESNNPRPVFQNNCSLELAKLSADERKTKKYREEYIDFKKDGKQMHILVKVDVTDIEQARQTAEQSEKLKNAFLANMSHDIRTPLNAVVGFASMINEVKDENQLKEFSDIISSNTEYLLTLIDEIIQLSQLQTKTNKNLERTQFDVIKMLHEMKAVFDNELDKAERSSDVKIIIDTPFESLKLWMDGNRARRLTTNLISNACKYTKTGHITVTVNYSLETGVFNAEFKDTGVGIPKNKVKDVFTPYTRVDKNRDKGFGLGLAICKAIMDNINGEIKLESTEGVGTKVLISFSPQVTSYTYKKIDKIKKNASKVV